MPDATNIPEYLRLNCSAYPAAFVMLVLHNAQRFSCPFLSFEQSETPNAVSVLRSLVLSKVQLSPIAVCHAYGKSAPFKQSRKHSCKKSSLHIEASVLSLPTSSGIGVITYDTSFSINEIISTTASSSASLRAANKAAYIPAKINTTQIVAAPAYFIKKLLCFINPCNPARSF